MLFLFDSRVNLYYFGKERKFYVIVNKVHSSFRYINFMYVFFMLKVECLNLLALLGYYKYFLVHICIIEMYVSPFRSGRERSCPFGGSVHVPKLTKLAISGRDTKGTTAQLQYEREVYDRWFKEDRTA